MACAIFGAKNLLVGVGESSILFAVMIYAGTLGPGFVGLCMKQASASKHK